MSVRKEFWRATKFSAALLWCLSSGLVAQSVEVNVFAGSSHLIHCPIKFTAGADEGMSIRDGCLFYDIITSESQGISSLITPDPKLMSITTGIRPHPVAVELYSFRHV